MPRSSARRAAGKGPYGPSFDASLTTRSRPSSRWTSSTGLPGSYGISPASAGRTNPAGMSVTLGAGVRLRLLPPEPERSADRREDRGERRLVQAAVLARPRNGRLRLPLAEALRQLPDPPSEHGVTPIDNPHLSLLKGAPGACERHDPRSWGRGHVRPRRLRRAAILAVDF